MLLVMKSRTRLTFEEEAENEDLLICKSRAKRVQISFWCTIDYCVLRVLNPKHMPKTTPTSNASNNNDQEDILQAVIVADSFNARFRPLSLHQPRCLIPLLNIPLIEYALETLASSGIQEIYIVCCAHALQIEDYVK